MAQPIQATPQARIPAERVQEDSYTVCQGDNLASIATKKFNDPNMLIKIWQLNEKLIGDNPLVLKPGIQLKMPAPLQPPIEEGLLEPLVPRRSKDEVAVTVPKADPKVPRKVITMDPIVIAAAAPAPRKTYVDKMAGDIDGMHEGAKNYAVATVKTPYHVGSAALETVVGAAEGLLGALKAGATLVTRGKADTDLLKESGESLKSAGNHVVGVVKAQGQAFTGVGQVAWNGLKGTVHSVGASVEGWASLLGLGVGLIGRAAEDTSIGDSYNRAKEIGLGNR